ncbi:MAG: hypothetical protein HY914_13795 [Desulfomonile tiedjei]|nr:hypothetical protein [Desulfomonile tiedjei]
MTPPGIPGRGREIMTDDPPSRQIDELKPGLFLYVTLAPLISALFAESINSTFVVCLFFVVLIGAAFHSFKKKLDTLEAAVREQEERLVQLQEELNRALAEAPEP